MHSSQMASSVCKRQEDTFYYACHEFIKTRAKMYCVATSVEICEHEKVYFAMTLGDQNKPREPHFTCELWKIRGKSFAWLDSGIF